MTDLEEIAVAYYLDFREDNEVSGLFLNDTVCFYVSPLLPISSFPSL